MNLISYLWIQQLASNICRHKLPQPYHQLQLLIQNLYFLQQELKINQFIFWEIIGANLILLLYYKVQVYKHYTLFLYFKKI